MNYALINNAKNKGLWRVSGIIVVGLLNLQLVFGQNQSQIKTLSIEDGLSNNSVSCIFQDKKGFMWFGTYDGLNRYDGYEFKVFRNKFKDSTSLHHNYISTISEDIKQNIWVGTGQGLTILDPVTNTFHWAYYWYNNKLARFNQSVTIIKTDRQGNFFIGTNNGGIYFKPEKSDYCIKLPFKNKTDGLNELSCQGMSINKLNSTWIFIANEGLCRYDYKTRKLELVSNILKTVNCINADNNGNVWLGTSNGLWKYTVLTRSLSGVRTYRSEKRSESNIISLLMDQDRYLYIGSERDGLCILNVESGKTDYLTQGETPLSLEKKTISDLYQDRESRIWIATLRTGLDIIDVQKDNFRTIMQIKGNADNLVSNFVTAFCEYDSNNLWIGTEESGISIWNRKKNAFINIKHSAYNPSSLSSDAITSIQKDFENRIWVGTLGGGANRYNTSNKSFEHFVCRNNFTGEINKDVGLLFEDSGKTLWAGTFANGRLYRFDRKKNEFNVFDQNITDPYSFFEDRRGQLWCGTAQELIKLDTITKKHHYYSIDKPIRTIFEDHAGRLWLGTEGGGLCLFDRKKGEITERYTDEDGLSNNAVLRILEDGAGKLWLSTFQGLTSFDYKRAKFTGYYASDGLQSNQFSFNAALKLKSGELAFGGIKGFNIFFPETIVSRNNMPQVVFTDININNKNITSVNRIVRDNGKEKTEGLEVPYNDAILSFSFAGLEFSSRDHIKYAYYLEGWDKKWIQSGTQRTINYNNLPEGDYTLHVKSTNALGKWNDKQASLKVVVLPPWFRTWWAYLFYIIVLADLIYTFIKYRANQANLKFQIKLERMNTEKEHEMNLRKSSFFTHVSHEFRTPLMLIINPLKEVLTTGDKKKNEELGIVYRNARRLLSLIDQLLLFNKTENDSTDLEISRLNFSILCRLTFESFLYQASNKNMTYTFEDDGSDIFLYGDKAKLEVILYNLLSNAFKFTRPEGMVTMKLEESFNSIDVSISDNGFGIPPDVGEHIFERFYRSTNREARQKAGFGIGLYLARQFTRLHKAKISYTSSAENGTTFFLNFKKGAAHFEGLPVAEASDHDTIFLDELAGEQDLIIARLEVSDFNNAADILNEKSIPCIESVPPIEQMISSRKTMLIIDDHPDMRTYIKQIFRNKFTIIEANNGEHGIQLAKEYIPDIIISDIMMEIKDGLEFCKELRENPSLTHIPVILVTASSSPEVRLNGIKGGADDYFTKPFDKELLIARINTLLNNKNNLQNYFYRKVTLQEYNVKISEEERNFIDQCIEIIERRLDDDEFSVDELAREMNMSRSNIFKRIRVVSNQTPNNFVKYIRLRRAAEYFINSGHNVNEVALMVGFKDIKYFREQFFQLFGLNPSEYIKKYRDPFSKNMSLNIRLKKNIRQKGY